MPNLHERTIFYMPQTLPGPSVTQAAWPQDLGSEPQIAGRLLRAAGNWNSVCNRRPEACELTDIRSREAELRALMVASLDGDATAHRSLLTRLGAHLRAYFKRQLARIGRGPAEAEDLVQEALIAIHTRRATYDRSQPLTPWVYAIARYKLLDHLRRTEGAIRDVPVEEAAGPGAR